MHFIFLASNYKRAVHLLTFMPVYISALFRIYHLEYSIKLHISMTPNLRWVVRMQVTFLESNIIIRCTCLDKTRLAPSVHAEQLHARYQQIFNGSNKISCLTPWIKLKAKFTLWIIYSTLFRINIPAEKENTLLVSGKEAHCKISLLPW